MNICGKNGVGERMTGGGMAFIYFFAIFVATLLKAFWTLECMLIK